MGSADPEPLRVDREGLALAGEREGPGDGPVVLCAHGLTATRSYVVHGSGVLPRQGYALVSYDARGHGSSDPPPDDEDAFSYPELAADLLAVLDEAAGGGPAVIVGHSMGAHTAIRVALERPGAVAGLVLVGPAWAGELPDDDELAKWDALAEGLESEGIEGFIAARKANDGDLDSEWEDVVERISRQRLGEHEHLDAVARALREVPRSAPLDGLAELERCEVPALVVASHDDADPGHPYQVAEQWAERLPDAELDSEQQGNSPLAWQGGRLSRRIDEFARGAAGAARLG